MTLMVAGCHAALHAAIINVPDPGAGIATIQDGVNAAASSGDTIRVAPGTYVESVDTLGKSVRIRATGSVNATIIDAGGLGFGPAATFDSGETRTTILEGFTLRGASEYAVICHGASPTILDCRFTTSGVRCDLGGAPLIENCTFTGGSNFEGGAVHVETGADPEFVDCDFTDNQSFLVGGAVLVREAAGRFTDCTFTDNTAPLGGGIAILDSTTSLTRCDFSGNQAETGGGGGWLVGGAPVLVQCSFAGGTASVGGGLYLSECPASVSSTTFTDNIAEQSGGALRLLAAEGATFTSCIFESNHAVEGGGADITDGSDGLAFINCAFRNGTADIGAGIDLGPAIGD
ncbi:MAG: hypothetical protein KDA21_11810, partial [Phycisphaerales bacterium]|nr:hypothetical protein [Phycisphaerales bacterium]